MAIPPRGWRVKARDRIDLRTEAAGRIREIGFREGAQVRAGQVIVRLEDAEARASRDRAAAKVRLSVATLKRVREQSTRSRRACSSWKPRWRIPPYAKRISPWPKPRWPRWRCAPPLRERSACGRSAWASGFPTDNY
ncbi:MAG: biotin/lipoyl-binding protein [Fibrobacteres bacterium]|nr:biotin/lipoyl-binding protein [Fibrobacterota bacterium]